MTTGGTAGADGAGCMDVLYFQASACHGNLIFVAFGDIVRFAFCENVFVVFFLNIALL